jgi:uncharacterized protein YutE (UPF0331/DUF86 family)
VDINNELIVSSGGIPPGSYYETFPELARLKVLPHQLAKRLAATTGLRNRIVHEYESVDLRLLFTALRSLKRDYSRYVQLIRARAGL